MSLLTTLDSLWQVVLVGLVLGAGLPVFFPLGLRFSTVGRGSTTMRPSLPAAAAAVVCFAVVLIALGAGILLITHEFLEDTFGFAVF
ncbi:hypothetical protein [Rhodococcus chondri]|uniref:Uncharacterized protein n=1 Tax=Rhodococcus chondri TaxID=3065941 RepID=A0ABU7JZV1_9NOCA|nr:hypothetical protein [Rhodococcus sp. CC-R104]MEE2035528.1 hypothetical protein [Rhodococcus sp. CC-R104]